jgi:hypothetical protein
MRPASILSFNRTELKEKCAVITSYNPATRDYRRYRSQY